MGVIAAPARISAGSPSHRSLQLPRYAHMRITAFGAIAVALCYGVVLGTLALFQRHLIYPGAFRNRPQSADRAAPPGSVAVALATADGETLHALWRAPRPG